MPAIVSEREASRLFSPSSWRHVYRKVGPALSWRLDMTRSLAACLVVLEHLRGAYFVAYPDLHADSKNPINAALFFVSRLGPEAVMVFFVLSGFLVGGSALVDLVDNRVRLRQYAVNRLSRMYTVLIPALVVGGIWDGLRYHLFHDPPGGPHLDSGTFLANAAFLQGIATPAFGGNVPLFILGFARRAFRNVELIEDMEGFKDGVATGRGLEDRL